MNFDADELGILFDYTEQPPLIKTSRWTGVSLTARESQLIAVISTPKSGSTWATNVIANSAGLPAKRFCYAWSSNEHELYEPALMMAKTQGGVAQLHMRATPHNVALMQQFGIKSLVLSRNVFDSVVSFARDLKKKLEAPITNPGELGYSFVWLSPDMSNWELEALIDYAIDFYLPWYLNFLRSWDCYRAHTQSVVLRYEVLRRDPGNVFSQTLQKLAVTPHAPIEQLIDKQFGNAELMSQSGSEDGSYKTVLGTAEIDRIKHLFKRESSAWVKSHLELPA